MRVGDTKAHSTIGRQTQFSLKRFYVDQIYFSDERIEPGVLHTDTVRINKHKRGLRIKARWIDGHCNIDIGCGELRQIKIIGPDECTIPYEKERDGVSDVLMGWASGIRSLHDTRLRIGGSVEFYYSDGDETFEVSLHHSKQALFDLFKHVRNHFGKYIIDTQGK
jgi:hypothetical protein